MYNVSSAFKQKMKTSSQKRRLYGTIGETSFTSKNVIQGSFKITNQCSPDQNILVGQVYVGELQATFRGLDIERNTYKGLEIVPYNGLEINQGQYEDVPLGHYFVDSAKWTSAGIVVVAYDAMSKFDKEFTENTLQGTIYSIITFACLRCGVTLGMTEAQIQDLANGTGERTLYPDNDIQTYRDLISWCAQTLGTNATIDRNGQLVFRPFNQTVVDTFTPKTRIQGCQFYDYETFYTGISVVNIAEQTTSYYGLPVDNGLTMNLGSNPLMQYGEESQLETQRRAVLDAIAVARYTPAKIPMVTPMVYDLMDVIEMSDGLVGEDETIKVCVTKFVWTFGGAYQIECTGMDPAVANARSKIDKQLQGIMSSSKQDTIEYYLFTNTDPIAILDGETKKIIDIRFASNKSTVVIFQAEVLVDISTTVELATYNDAICSIQYRYNGVYIDEYQPQETWVDGKHMLHLLYYVEIQTAIEARLEVLLTMDGGNMSIQVGGVRSSIYGQALAATDRWDGTIDLREQLATVNIAGTIPTVISKSLVDSAGITLQTPIDLVFSTEIANEDNLLYQPGITNKSLTEELLVEQNDEEPT